MFVDWVTHAFTKFNDNNPRYAILAKDLATSRYKNVSEHIIRQFILYMWKFRGIKVSVIISNVMYEKFLVCKDMLHTSSFYSVIQTFHQFSCKTAVFIEL